MATALQRLRNLFVKEVSLVDEGDNPLARFSLWKRRHSPTNRPDRPGYDPKARTRKQPTAAGVHVDSTERDPRKRPRRGRGAVDGGNHVAKLTVRTENQDSGGVSPHGHGLELPDGAIAAGRYRTEAEQDHHHDLELANDLRPGQTVTVETGPADPPPPAGVEQHTHRAEITATERVAAQRTDKQDQDFQTRDGERFRGNAFAFAPADSNPSDWKLLLFDSQADADANRPSVKATAGAAQALSPEGFRGQSVEIPADDRGGVINKVRAAWLRARRQADQDVSREDLPPVLKSSLFGRITEAFYKWSGLDSPDEELEQLLEDELDDVTEPQAPDASATEEGQMDLAKLTKEDREKVEAALAEAGSVEVFAKNFANLKLLITKGAETAAELAKLKGKDQDPDPLEGVPEEIRKIVEPQLKAANERTAAVETENSTLKVRLDKIDADLARVTFEKSVGDLNGLAQARDELVGTLWAIPDAEARLKVQKSLEAAAAAARRGDIYGEIGSGLSEGGSAYAKIEAAAEELRKADPKMSEAVAKAKVMNDHPDLYDAYLEETGGVAN